MKEINIEEILGGQIVDENDDMSIPLLNSKESFGFDDATVYLSGVFINDNTVTYTGRYIIDLTSAGFSPVQESSIAGALRYEYNPYSDEWEFDQGEVKIAGSGGLEFTRDYGIPGLTKLARRFGIAVSAYITLDMQMTAEGTFIVADGGDTYQGILRFEPIPEIIAGAGHEKFKIEGYGGGVLGAEVHTTGYIKVEPELHTGARWTFLVWDGTLFHVSTSTVWENDVEKVDSILASVKPQYLLVAYSINGNDEEEALEVLELTPMSREYLKNSSTWLAGQKNKVEGPILAAEDLSPIMIMSMEPTPAEAEKTNPHIKKMKEYIFPDSEVQLVCNGDELWMLWIDDNSKRSDMNRTQLMYSVLKDGNWSEPKWIDEDGTADFSPVAASDGNGVLMAWQNVKVPIAEDSEVSDFMKNVEITVTESVYKADGSDVQLVTLTDDEKYEHSPELAVGKNYGLLTWMKTGLEETDDQDQFVFSSWDGSGWSKPEVISDSLSGEVINSSLAMHEDEGLLLYTLNITDNETDDIEQKICARVYDGDSWGDEILITADDESGLSASNPQAVYSDGKWFITWYQGEGIMYKEGLDGEIKTEEFLDKVQSNYKIVRKNGENPQIALIYQQKGKDNVRNLSASFYDINKGIWSDEIPLTAEEDYIRSFSPVFTEDGKLSIAYTQAEIIMEVIDNMEVKRPGSEVDLYTLTYTPIHDLAIDENNGLSSSPELPLPGSVVTATVEIKNEGDFPENATIYLYNGDPESGGKKIGEAVTAEPIPARSSTQLDVEWSVDFEQKDKYDIYAVVHSDSGVTEIDTSNNTVHLEITTADLAVADLGYEHLGKDDYLVTAVIKNVGGKYLEGVKVYLDNYNQDEQNGEPLKTKELEQLEPGQQVDLTFLVSLDELTKDENDKFTMLVSAYLTDETDEFNLENNNYYFELKPTPIDVVSLKPGYGERSADIEEPIILNFNMHIEEGADFNEITLNDDYLNTVDISTELDGKTLTVTPKSPLNYDTQYTLTIQEGALKNSYGHTMDGPYELSFKTTINSPEVVFAYPGNAYVNVDVDTDVTMQFNQDVQEDINFDEIKLYVLDSNNTIDISATVEEKYEVPASVSLQGDLLNINPNSPLEGNTAYRVLIPAGAVKNQNGDVLKEDYAFYFETEEGEGIDEDDDSGSEDEDKDDDSGSEAKRGDYKISRKLSEDGRTTVVVNITEQSLPGSKDKTAVIDLTDIVAEDEIIIVNVDTGALEELVSSQRNLNIITGKGDLLNSYRILESLFGEEKNSISITIAENNEIKTANNRVSSGIFDFSITAGDEHITEFSEAIIITIPLDMSLIEDERRVIVCAYDEETGNWKPVGGTADAVQGSITFSAMHFSTCAAFENPKHFDDVTADWAKEEIQILASRGLINGVAENVFNPEGKITRAEFTALIVRSLYIDLLNSRGTFTDVPENAWFADVVETAYNLGLIKGTGQNTFSPNWQITREQLAVIAYRFYKYKTGDETSPGNGNEFTDQYDISSWAKEAVNFVANAEIMLGSEGKFYPERSTTRQEAAVVLYRLLEYMGEI